MTGGFSVEIIAFLIHSTFCRKAENDTSRKIINIHIINFNLCSQLQCLFSNMNESFRLVIFILFILNANNETLTDANRISM